MRRDIETGGRNGVMSLTLAANHTLKAPGVAGGASSSEITSDLIFVATSGGARELTLCDPAEYIGVLEIVFYSDGGNLTVKHTSGSTTQMTNPGILHALSDGSDWYVKVDGALSDMTA